MMQQKVFMEYGNLKLWGDPRDIPVPSNLRKDVYTWCVSNDVVADMPLNRDYRHISERYFGLDIWRVKDERERVMFALRWS